MQKTRKPAADPRQCCSNKMVSCKKKNLMIGGLGALLKKGSPGFVALCVGKVLQLSHFGLAVVCGDTHSVESRNLRSRNSASGELLAA